MANKKIIDLDAGQLAATSLLETSQVDSGEVSGRKSTKVSGTDLGNFVAGQGLEPLEYGSLQTASKKLIGAINEVRNIAYNAYPTDELSGNIATFESPAELPLLSCIANITAIQEGSGDPSPDNVRPITGFDGLELSHSGADTSNPDIISIDWSEEGTVYGGTLDVISGVLIVTYFSFIGNQNLTITKIRTDDGISTFFLRTSNNNMPLPVNNTIKSSHFSSDIASGSGRMVQATTDIYMVIDNTLLSEDTASGFVDWLTTNNVHFIYELATPTEIQLTPEEITALVGTNNIWADTGDISVTAKVTVEDYINRRIGNNNRSLSAPLSLTKGEVTEGEEVKEVEEKEVKEKGEGDNADIEKK